MLTLPAPPGRVSGPGQTMRLFFLRGPGPDFSERDRALLVLLRPHLHQAYLDAERRRHPIPQLTPRQKDLLRLVAAGHTNAQIARRLGLSEGTVRTHLENIYGRLQVSSRTAAVTRACKGPHQTAAGLGYASGTASRADLAAGQRAQVKVPGKRTRESALNTSPPANRPAAVSPMGGGAAHKDHSQGPEGAGRATHVPHVTVASGQSRSLLHLSIAINRTTVIADHVTDLATDLAS